MSDELSSSTTHQDGQQGGAPLASGDDDLTANHNPYTAPSASSGTETPVVESDLTEELTAIVGLKKSDYYLERWNTIRCGGRGGWNWAAFFLLGWWLAYRKMYKYAFIYWGIIILESTLENVYFVGLAGMSEPPRIVQHFVLLLSSAICGSYGNGWYLSHAKWVIGEVREEGLSGEAQLQRLSERGGTNLLAALGIGTLAIVTCLVVLIALDLTLFPGLVPTE